MKVKIIFLIFMITMMNILTANANDNKVYFYGKSSCPYCRKATDYIKKELPDLKYEYVNISTRSGMEKIIKEIKKLNLDKNKVGIPLIVIGSDYIMGWRGNEDGELLKEYIKKTELINNNCI